MSRRIRVDEIDYGRVYLNQESDSSDNEYLNEQVLEYEDLVDLDEVVLRPVPEEFLKLLINNKFT